MTNKSQLLNELEGLGIRADGRKIRGDKGKPRKPYVKHTSAPRADAGKKRDSYNTQSAQHNRRIFEQFIRAHTNQVTGDDLTRDANMIFPPNVDSYYKTVKGKNGTYKSSVKRANHPEYLRWKWYFAEYQEAKDEVEKFKWIQQICLWYFILPKDIDNWTYDEWAWCYYSYIAGEENRNKWHKKILSYDDFLKGKYGQIVFDGNGDIVWDRK